MNMTYRSTTLLCVLIGLSGASDARAAGSVNAVISGEYLIISGDTADNKLKISDKDSDDIWTITGVGGTLINGLPELTIGVQNIVRITLGEGDDQVKLDDASVPAYLDVWLGSGDDKATISDTDVGFSFDVIGAEGGDKVTVKNVTAPERCEFDMDDAVGADDSVKIKGLTCSGGIDISVEDGDDKVTVADVVLPAEEFNFITVLTGSGRDSVKLASLDSTYLTVELSDGDDDSLKISRCIADNNTLDGGAGIGDRLIVDDESSLGVGTPANFEE